MLKILFTADWHINNTSLLDRKIGSGYFGTKIGILEAIVEYAISLKFTDFVILGDVFNRPDPSPFLRKEFYRLLSKLLNRMRVWIIFGNHDFESNNESVLSELSMLPLSENLHIYKRGIFRSFRKSNDVYFVPWNNDVKRIRETKFRFLLGHIAINGFKMSDGKLCTGYTSKKAIKKLGCQHCIFGHFHIPSSKGNIHYCGSPYPITFNEKHSLKRILVYHKKKLESVLIGDVIKKVDWGVRQIVFADITINSKKDLKSARKFAVEEDDFRQNVIFRIKYNYKKIYNRDIESLADCFESHNSNFMVPFYIDIKPFKDDEDKMINEINENNVIFGLGEYINEHWDKSLKSSALKILREAENDIFEKH